MKTTLTKFFYFSASFSRSTKVHGHNYILAVTIEALKEELEADFIGRVEESLIQKIQSRDLGADVDFLKGIEISDVKLLEIFSKIITKAAPSVRLLSLSLERDKRTLTEYFIDENIS